MPVLDVEIVLKPGEEIAQGIARRIADRAGEIFGSRPRTTWVKLRAIPDDHYAENDAGPEIESHPVFVSILKAKLPPPDQMQREVDVLTPAIAEICGRPPENVHILYLPAGAGRIAFGGRIVSG
jgi:phenylpyruvate tautomerase PptA (4-oxalocrotonate tautomerase family)